MRRRWLTWWFCNLKNLLPMLITVHSSWFKNMAAGMFVFYSSVFVMTSNLKLYIKLNAMPFLKRKQTIHTQTHRFIYYFCINKGWPLFLFQTYPNHFHTAPNYELTFSQKHSYPRLHFSNLKPSLNKQWNQMGKKRKGWNPSHPSPAKHPSCAYYDTDSR